MVISVGAAAVSFMRRIWMGVSKGDIAQVNGVLHSEVADYIQNKKRNDLISLEKRYGVTINIKADHTVPPGDGKLDFVKEE